MNKKEIADLINDIRTDMNICKDIYKNNNEDNNKDYKLYILARNTELLCVIAEILNKDVEGE